MSEGGEAGYILSRAESQLPQISRRVIILQTFRLAGTGPIITSTHERLRGLIVKNYQLDLAFNNVKPKDWYFVIDLV